MSIRDEQKEQRRQLIMDKAIELFAKKGYADTKIGDIAQAADMSVGLMFHYFESKRLNNECFRVFKSRMFGGGTERLSDSLACRFCGWYGISIRPVTNSCGRSV